MLRKMAELFDSVCRLCLLCSLSCSIQLHCAAYRESDVISCMAVGLNIMPTLTLTVLVQPIHYASDGSPKTEPF